jgi:hypothetical protein
MALNLAKVGAVYPTYRYEVSREKIREYALALGESDPRYTSQGDDCVAPPTFAAAFTITRGALDLFADPELGAHPALVHGSQRFAWQGRPLRPGDVLACTPRIASITHRGRNEFLTIALDCVHEASGEPALTAETTIVFLGSAPQDAAGEGAA